MDRPGGAVRVLIAAAGALLVGAAAPATLEALVWIAPGHEAAALSRQPATCLATPDEPAVVAGRALFNAPNLLGGQASRAGVSCASCHSNGRTNAHFFLAGVSDEPGSADVSQSFFSPLRGNGRFDPKPIPDLAAAGKVSRRASGELERFMRGLIVEEFSGAEPTPATLSALGGYVRAIRACSGRADEPRTLAGQLDLVRASARSAAWFAQAGDATAAKLLVGAARRQLGLVDERLAPGGNRTARKALLAASRELQRTAPTPAALGAWLIRFDAHTAPMVARAEPRSLYRPERLARWLGKQRTAAR
jgi:hypothetical protein